MSRFYTSPLRVYLLLGALAALGIFSALKLSVSLFPNSTKPAIWVTIPYGHQTADEFLNAHGALFESQLRAISNDNVKVESIEATYASHSASFEVNFPWGTPPESAKREVLNVTHAFSPRLPQEASDHVDVEMSRRNSGFFAMSFYSEKRSLTELYDFLEPLITPSISKITDAQQPRLFNPESQEIRVQIRSEAITALQLLPRDIELAIQSALGSRSGGVLASGNANYNIEMPRAVTDVETLAQILIQTPSGKLVHLSEVAQVDLASKSMETESLRWAELEKRLHNSVIR